MMLNYLRHDLRLAVRQLGARPGFAIAAILTLALGIGANALVFSLIDRIYLRPLPYRDDAALIDLGNSYPALNLLNAGVSIPDYLDRHGHVPALADSAIYSSVNRNFSDGVALERLSGVLATPSLFSTLGVGAAIGRVYTDEETQVGAGKVVVLAHGLWRDRFGGDRGVIGREIRIDGENHRVIGVMPEGFAFPDSGTQLFLPFVFTAAQKADESRGNEFSGMVARLAPGATQAQVKAQCDAIVRANVERFGALGGEGASYAKFVQTSGFSVSTRTLREQLAGDNSRVLFLLQGAVALVLLIACANIANLMLTRLSARRKELSIRSALGAGRGRIARQLFGEALVLALAGGTVGVVFAMLGARVVAASGLLPDWVGFAVDLRTLAFAAATSIVAGVLFGLLPAFGAATVRPEAALRESGRLGGGGRAARRTRTTLVVVQLALAVALVASAGLLLRSFAQVAQQDPGFRGDAVLSAALTLPATKYPDRESRARAMASILQRVRSLPGVDDAGLTTAPPMANAGNTASFRIAGRDASGPAAHGFVRDVDENYFSTMGIPVLRGRAFTTADWNSPEHVVIIDALFARKHFGSGDPIGQRIELGSTTAPAPYTIVGVVGTVKNRDLAEDVVKETYYRNYGQAASGTAVLVLRASVPPSTLAEPLRAAVREVDADQPLFDVATMDQRISGALAGRRVPMQLVGAFAVLALVLAAIGIYGVLAFTVSQRTGELGVRMAIGADAASIRRLVLRDGGRLIALGLGIGLLGALALGSALRSQLYGVGGADPLVLGSVVALLAAIALVACWLPARRASRVAPVSALRYE